MSSHQANIPPTSSSLNGSPLPHSHPQRLPVYQQPVLLTRPANIYPPNLPYGQNRPMQGPISPGYGPPPSIPQRFGSTPIQGIQGYMPRMGSGISSSATPTPQPVKQIYPLPCHKNLARNAASAIAFQTGFNRIEDSALSLLAAIIERASLNLLKEVSTVSFLSQTSSPDLIDSSLALLAGYVGQGLSCPQLQSPHNRLGLLAIHGDGEAIETFEIDFDGPVVQGCCKRAKSHTNVATPLESLAASELLNYTRIITYSPVDSTKLLGSVNEPEKKSKSWRRRLALQNITSPVNAVPLCKNNASTAFPDRAIHSVEEEENDQ